MTPKRSGIRRYYQQGTKRVFAVKRIAKQYRDDFAYLFDNEAAALTTANNAGVPRVATVVEQGFSLSGDLCLVLK